MSHPAFFLSAANNAMSQQIIPRRRASMRLNRREGHRHPRAASDQAYQSSSEASRSGGGRPAKRATRSVARIARLVASNRRADEQSVIRRLPFGGRRCAFPPYACWGHAAPHLASLKRRRSGQTSQALVAAARCRGRSRLGVAETSRSCPHPALPRWRGRVRQRRRGGTVRPGHRPAGARTSRLPT